MYWDMTSKSEKMIDWDKYDYREWSMPDDELGETHSRYFGCIDKRDYSNSD